MPAPRKYTDKQKIAYYKKKAAAKGRGAYSISRRPSHARAAMGAARGRGKYEDTRWKLASGLGSIAGGVVGSAFGPVGTALGASLGGLAGGAIFGSGKYNLKNNSLFSEGVDPPSMHQVNSAVRIRHREYVCDIVSSSSANTFNNQSFPIQPGLFQSYPWLSALAQQYEEQKPLGIIYEFKTLSATAIASGTNSTMGGVIMATDYNSINAAFVNKQQMDNTEYTTSAPVWQSFYHPVECDPRTNPISTLYVRSGAVPSNSDQRLYDLGLFQIASFGVQGTSVVLGELWVTYEWEFRKPISTSALGQDVLSDHIDITAGVDGAHPLGTANSLKSGSSIGGTISGQSYLFPPVYQEGTFLVLYQATGTANTVTSPIITLTNATQLQMWGNDTSQAAAAPQNGVSTSSQYVLAFVVNITGSNAKIAFGVAGSLPNSISHADLVITQWDQNIST